MISRELFIKAITNYPMVFRFNQYYNSETSMHIRDTIIRTIREQTGIYLLVGGFRSIFCDSLLVVGISKRELEKSKIIPVLYSYSDTHGPLISTFYNEIVSSYTLGFIEQFNVTNYLTSDFVAECIDEFMKPGLTIEKL